jgi:pimeloyl-ACP methyl ester carboxylesterase
MAPEPFHHCGKMCGVVMAEHSTAKQQPVRSLFRICLTLALLAAILLSADGCSRNKYLGVRKVPKNPLAGPLNLLSRQGPRPTKRTSQTLRRLDLEEQLESDRDGTLAELQRNVAVDPTADKMHAIAEIAYIAGYEADQFGRDGEALDYYGTAVAYAYYYLFDPAYDRFRNPYDPQFRRACDLYNGALEAALRIVQDQGHLLPGETVELDTGTRQLFVSVESRGSWQNHEFKKLEFVSDYSITGLTNQNHSYGLGVPLIAVRHSENTGHPAEKYYPKVLCFPVTAFLRVIPRSPDEPPDAPRHCRLELYDPLDAINITVANRLVPLETDLSVPLGYTLEKGRKKSHTGLVATWGLLDPDSASELEGVYMVEPYEPRKIPVLMVHGLWSSPLTWMEMFNDLLSFPEIRENYQFWFYMYPTGQPFWISANQMRQDLVEIRQTLDPMRQNPTFDQMVVVGHSMGGLVSTMQTLDSGNDFWSILSERPFQELQADPEVREEVASTVFFEPNPSIRRLITIGTPHRGSKFANDYTKFLARKFIKLPSRVLWATQQLRMQNPGFFRDTELMTISTSIDSLAPDSPILPVMLQAHKSNVTQYHNVVGVVEEKSWLGNWTAEGDGVVSYASATRPDFSTEVVVDADHVSVHAHPRSILEVRRILLDHLAQLRWQPPGAPVASGGRAMDPAHAARSGHQSGTAHENISRYPLNMPR